MKKAWWILSALLLLSCSNGESGARKSAVAFLEAYLVQRDAAAVSAVSSPAIAEQVKEHFVEMEEKYGDEAEKVNALIDSVTCEIVRCEVSEDTAHVDYRLGRGRDSVSMEKSLTLIKDEEGWKVVAFSNGDIR